MDARERHAELLLLLIPQTPADVRHLPPPRAENEEQIKQERAALLSNHKYCVEVEVMSHDCERSVSWLFVNVAAANHCLDEMRHTPELHRLRKRVRFGLCDSYVRMPGRATHRLIPRVNFERPADVETMLRVVKLNIKG